MDLFKSHRKYPTRRDLNTSKDLVHKKKIESHLTTVHKYIYKKKIEGPLAVKKV